eukprot:TRINITY_DN45355_c0_g1_i1.p1 TRINITY_DN45355_c0_g1~~TRINITY_DN45355_c0_g1_i1.p1  ORF type:complete len:212 (-),score=33.78 TRINITY_DN45355_c0_g1_i1:85-720(-)
MRPSMPRQYSGPLPPYESPPLRGADFLNASASVRKPSLTRTSAAYPSTRRLLDGQPSLSSPRPSSGSSFALKTDFLRSSASSSRATTASGSSRPDDLFGASAGDAQADQLVRSMLPTLRRAMSSQNQAVFQASLDSIKRLEKMFGKDAFDRNVEILVKALEVQGAQTHGAHRAGIVFETLLSLCSEETASSLRARFPQYVAPQAGEASASS